ncbi:glycosyl transferase family 2 [Vibrio nigripulchritudo ATCC 27043]|uniref:glycosyltransferase family 2 protein n=1 Tax=Vibrio nigripulchritudo TaxID=28173 RepID=UPI00021C1896|nr:glycosyltransferase family 2 protein [Vibrio nigripulchritudo]EGU56684.1 glycosyl transferase family 2 [Vibrio nigripulchritudo ATCC 27043]
MKFSIVIPTFNSEEFISETLDSLDSQTYKNFEVIISDGLSTDNTLSIAESYSKDFDVLVRSSKDSGMYDALNKGFDLASGDIYCYLNSDDLYEPDTLEVVLKQFMNEPNAEFIFGNMYIFTKEYKQKVVYPPLIKTFFKNVNYSMFGQPSTFWKSELYSEVGGFDSQLKMAGDYDFFCRCLDREISRSSKYLSSFRVHDSSLTSNHGDISLLEMQGVRSKYYNLKKRNPFLVIISELYFKVSNLSTIYKRLRRSILKRKLS